MNKHLGALLAFVSILFCVIPAQSQAIIETLDGAKPGPQYEVDLADAINHYMTVTMIAESDGDSVELMMPVWTPGSYMVREYAKYIDRITATTEKGRKLNITKISKNRWVVATKQPRTFKVEYRVFCDEKSVRDNYTNHNYAMLNGAPSFLTVVAAN